MANWCCVWLTVVGLRAEARRFARDANVPAFISKSLDPAIDAKVKAGKKLTTAEQNVVVDWLIATEERKRDELAAYVASRPRARPTDIFTPDMLLGEMQAMSPLRMKALGNGLSQKTYVFQIRNDDGRTHFRRVSRRYPPLYFVLTYWDPNSGEYGSYLIRDGRSRWHLVDEEGIESMMRKHGCDFESEDVDEDENELGYMEASWELMDQCEERWLKVVYKRLGVHRPPEDG